MKELDLLNKIYEITGGINVSDLISEYEFNYHYSMQLEYRNIYKLNNKILISVFDNVTQTGFDLIFNENSKKLDLYYPEEVEK